MSKELQKQTVDRVLEALSPALAAELERMSNEIRSTMEADFEKRLWQAVQDAEASANKTSEAETQRALQEARESVRGQVAAELQEQFARVLEENNESVRQQVSEEAKAEYERLLLANQASVRQQVIDEQRQESAKAVAESDTTLRAKFDGEYTRAQLEWAAERERLQQEQTDLWHLVTDAQRQLAEAPSQQEILSRWLKLVQPFSSSIAIYTARANGLAIWKSHGGGAFPELISTETTIPECYFKLIVVRDKTVAAVCAAEPYRAEVLDFLVTTMERAIELFGWKLRTPVAKTASAESARAQ